MCPRSYFEFRREGGLLQKQDSCKGLGLTIAGLVMDKSGRWSCEKYGVVEKGEIVCESDNIADALLALVFAHEVYNCEINVDELNASWPIHFVYSVVLGCESGCENKLKNAGAMKRLTNQLSTLINVGDDTLLKNAPAATTVEREIKRTSSRGRKKKNENEEEVVSKKSKSRKK